MAFFGNRNVNGAVANDPYAKYNRNISNILIVVAFSAINLIMLALDGESYFLFSAFVPYYVAYYGMFWTGSFPAEMYADSPGIEADFLGKSFLGITFGIGVVVILVYLLCWFLAKKKKVGALIFALVFFVIDTIAMFAVYGLSADGILDIAFHIWILVYLVMGIVAFYKAKDAQPEEAQLNEYNENQVATEGASLNGTGISDPYATSSTSNYEGTDVEG